MLGDLSERKNLTLRCVTPHKTTMKVAVAVVVVGVGEWGSTVTMAMTEPPSQVISPSACTVVKITH